MTTLPSVTLAQTLRAAVDTDAAAWSMAAAIENNMDSQERLPGSRSNHIPVASSLDEVQRALAGTVPQALLRRGNLENRDLAECACGQCRHNVATSVCYDLPPGWTQCYAGTTLVQCSQKKVYCPASTPCRHDADGHCMEVDAQTGTCPAGTTVYTPQPTASPTHQPSAAPSRQPSESPVAAPSAKPSAMPSESPIAAPSASPIAAPSSSPSKAPTKEEDPIVYSNAQMIFRQDDFVSCWYNTTEATAHGASWLVPYVNQRRYCAVSTPLFGDGATCGKCYEVVYDGGISGSRPGSAIVQIVDELQEYTSLYQFDCYVDTYTSITGGRLGGAAVPIRYRPVDCTVTGPSAVILPGSHAWWINVLIAGGPTGVTAVTMRIGTTSYVLSRDHRAALWKSLLSGLTNQAVHFDITFADGTSSTLTCFNNVWPVPVSTQCHATK